MRPQIPVSMSFEDWQRLVSHLAEQPFGKVADLISTIQQQVTQHMQAQQQAAAGNGEAKRGMQTDA